MSGTQTGDIRYTVAAYFDMAERGLLEDRHVELLEGLIVSEPPQDPAHATATMQTAEVLRRAIGERAAIRSQLPLVVGPYSAPEPDVAVVPGVLGDYSREHPSTALLVVEVARTSLPQDRLSKSRLYARANIAEYWLLNLRDHCLEVFRSPDPEAGIYRRRILAAGGDTIAPCAFPDAEIAVSELLPH